MTGPQVARTVVYRHPCDCDTASRPLNPGEEAEHRFDVDGKPFPWLIRDDGPTIVQRGQIYLVTVPIIPMETAGGAVLTVSHCSHGQPRIGDRPFPWIITQRFDYTVTEGGFGVLTLTFFAEHVDADYDIPIRDVL